MSSSPSTILPGEVGNAAEIAGILAKAAGANAGAILRRGRAPQVAVDAKITAPNRLVMVSKVHTEPKRVEIVVGTTDKKFPRGGTLELIRTATSGSIRFFDAVKEGNEVLNDTLTGRVCTAVELKAGFHIFAQGAGPSANLDDVHLKLTLEAGPTTGKSAEITLTAIELTLDISPPRTSPATPFAPLPQPKVLPPNVTPTDKWFAGVVINAQDPDNNQPRAQLIVGQVKPLGFNGELVLQQVGVVNEKTAKKVNRAQLFENEIPGPKQTPKVAEAAKTNPFFFKADTITSPAGRGFFIEGKTASATLRDTAFQLGIKDLENDGDRVAFAVAVAPLITVDSTVVVAKKPHTNPARRKIKLSTSAPFDRKSTLKRSDNGPIKFFDKSKDGTEIDLKNAGREFSPDELKKGIELFAESENPSATLDECKLTYTLETGATPVGGATTLSLTAFDFTLDICGPRTAPAVEPSALSLADKSNPGRFLQLRNTDFTHLRALVIMRPPKPAGFTGTLVLTPLSPRVQPFRAETPGAGQTAETTPFTIPGGNIQPAGERFFAEGVTLSGAVRDTGFRLGIQGLENEADRVTVTVFDLAITNNVAPFATALARAQIEGVLAPDRTSFDIGDLFGKQRDSLFRLRADLAGVTGNTIQVRLISLLADGTEAERQTFTLTRRSGDRFVSLPMMAIPVAAQRAGLVFKAPQDIDIILATAGGRLRLETLVPFPGVGVAQTRVRGRVIRLSVNNLNTSGVNAGEAVNAITLAQRTWAQAGIELRLVGPITPQTDPGGLNNIQQLPNNFSDNLGPDRATLFGLNPTPDIDIYFVNNVQGAFGEAFGSNDLNAPMAANFGNMIIEQGTVVRNTMAHELGHILFDLPRTVNGGGDEHSLFTINAAGGLVSGLAAPITNIMGVGNPVTRTDMTQAQCLRAFASPFVAFVE